MLLLAVASTPPPALLCTIKTVESHWQPRPIRSVRVLEGMQFRLQPGPPITVEPRYVIDSRLTLLADEPQAPVLTRQPDGSINYSWSFEAPLGAISSDPDNPVTINDSLATIEGRLTIQSDRRFTLVNLSSVSARNGGSVLTRLREEASGRCDEQR
ncbi:hypothetical protein KR100_04940 [Synechococcus sp. KORDI-100]|uniref:hypothetical protein n=1 Tax=Synechococcus sp. KORDI-100 TaxID=1280380 RepID=UPI0004E0628B|nr:hypothetical protein [Synechococcus sp. KORDI-100]AII42710.1 hypothetical protein KR100_04940 [Synechococcus sp. KORDI-100]